MTLPENAITEGESLLKRLDEAQVDVRAAVWLYNAESESWKLLLSVPDLIAEGPKKAYQGVQRVLSAMGASTLALHDIWVTGQDDRILKLLRRAVKTGLGDGRIRFSKNAINGEFVEDALIYRLR